MTTQGYAQFVNPGLICFVIPGLTRDPFVHNHGCRIKSGMTARCGYRIKSSMTARFGYRFKSGMTKRLSCSPKSGMPFGL
jgi:hypothetical protein